MTTVGASLLTLGLASTAQAEIDTEFHVGYNSDYVYRGADLGDSAFEYGLDVSGECDCGLGWNAGIWHISPNQGGDDELDIYAGLSKDLGAGTLSFGITNYQYDAGNDDSEVYLGYSAEISGFNAGVTIYYGFDGAIDEMVLAEGTLGYEHEICSKMSLGIEGAVGYLIDNATSDSGYAYSSVSASLSIALSEDITLSPYVAYANGDSSIVGAGRFNGFLYGASLGFAF